MSIDKDWKRTVSKPTEADFARGVADSATNHNLGKHIVQAVAAGALISMLLRRL